MREEWIELEDFPNFAVSNTGQVVNIKSGNTRKIVRNQQGIGMVTLPDAAGKYRTISVSKAVALAFLPEGYDEEIWNTPINLDGDRANANVENLLWRPRWFAIKYHKQFFYPDFNLVRLPLREINTGERFENIREACVKYGLYFNNVISSCSNGPAVFPTWQEFEWIR